MKRLFRGMMAVLLLVATFIPFINVNATESSRVQIIMSESVGNKHGTYIVSGGSFGVTINLDSSIAEFVDIGTEIILSVTPDTNYGFVGWFKAVEGANGYEPTDVLSGLPTYTFTVEDPYYNIMPVFENQTSCSGAMGHNNIWVTSGGKEAVVYEPMGKDGTNFVGGEEVNYCIGDEITVKAQANEGYYFTGWYVSNVQQGPEYYESSKLVSTNANYTYKPGVTTVSGIDEPINYITAVFSPNSSKPRRTVVTEFIARPYDTEEVPYDTDLATYTSSKKWNVTTEGTDINNSWLELFGEVDGVWQYPAERGVTFTFVEQEETEIEIINKYTITYDQVIVTKESAPTDPSTDKPETPVYTILEGDNQIYTLGSNTNIVIKASGNLDKLQAIEIDNGNAISSSNYELASGSTILTILSSFLENSSIGEHTITFRYNDGEVSTKLTIANATNNNPTFISNNTDNTNVTNNPQTADNVVFYISMLGLSIIALGSVGIYTKRKFFS